MLKWNHKEMMITLTILRMRWWIKKSRIEKSLRIVINLLNKKMMKVQDHRRPQDQTFRNRIMMWIKLMKVVQQVRKYLKEINSITTNKLDCTKKSIRFSPLKIGTSMKITSSIRTKVFSGRSRKINCKRKSNKRRKQR